MSESTSRLYPYPAWDYATYPYLVRWTSRHPSPIVRWQTTVREFRTLEDAAEAYKRPFKGISVDLVAYNGMPPGKHLDRLAHRKTGKPTKWADKVPSSLRALVAR